MHAIALRCRPSSSLRSRPSSPPTSLTSTADSTSAQGERLQRERGVGRGGSAAPWAARRARSPAGSPWHGRKVRRRWVWAWWAASRGRVLLARRRMSPRAPRSAAGSSWSAAPRRDRGASSPAAEPRGIQPFTRPPKTQLQKKNRATRRAVGEFPALLGRGTGTSSRSTKTGRFIDSVLSCRFTGQFARCDARRGSTVFAFARGAARMLPRRRATMMAPACALSAAFDLPRSSSNAESAGRAPWRLSPWVSSLAERLAHLSGCPTGSL